MSLRSVLAWLSLVLCISDGRAAEGRITDSDLAEIRQVIHRQIDAFRRDDAQGAFELVSPSVRLSFGTPERFLDVVRMAYRAVYRASNIAFLDLLVMSGDVVQQVQITDRGGGRWMAYFSMQRQSDGSWRMNGCRLVQPARTISA
jgi:uncharacterized protein DUF4864